MQCKLTLLSALFLLSCETSREIDTPNTVDSYSAVKTALCDKQVVLLGEGAGHNEGATNAFKSQLVIELMQNCGFSLIVFESSFFEYRISNKDLRFKKFDDVSFMRSFVKLLHPQILSEAFDIRYSLTTTKERVIGCLSWQFLF